MSEISKALDSILRRSLNGLLKTENFRKYGRRYYRVVGERIEQVQIESSSWNYGNKGQFWVCLSVYEPKIAKVLGQQIKGDRPKGFESGLFTTLGRIMPEGKQDSWDFYVDSENSELGERLILAIEQYALPWFYTTRKKEGMIKYLENLGALHILSIVYLLDGNNSAAITTLKELIEVNPQATDSAMRWARDFGVKFS